MARYITKPEPHGVLISRPGVAEMYLPYAEYKQLRQLPADSKAEFIYTHHQVHQVVQGIDPELHFLPVQDTSNTIRIKAGGTYTLKNGHIVTVTDMRMGFLWYSITGYAEDCFCTVQEFLDRIQI